MHIMKKTALVLACILVSFTFTIQVKAQGLTSEGIRLRCEFLHFVESQYIKEHVNFSKFSKNLEKRTVDQFIKRFDASKMYLRQADVAKIKTSLKGMFRKIKNRDCSPIHNTHELVKKRIKERVDYVKKELGPQFKLDKKTELIVDADKRTYAKSLKEQNAYHKKYIQLQVANYISTDMSLKEAKDHVIRNYERVYKRMDDMDPSRLFDEYLNAFAKGLDPHSSFFSRDELEDFKIQMSLSLEGIGATLSSRDGFTTIEQLIAGGAAFASGKLQPKDKIIAVAQHEKGDKFKKSENVIEMELRDVVSRIRGNKGTKVQLTILRKEGKANKRFDVVLVRDKIKLEDEAANIEYIEKDVNGVKKTIGILNLPSFYADNSKLSGRSAAADMKKLLVEAKKKKVDGILLDLSTNGGGSLDDAVKIAGLFFKTGNVVKQSQKDATKGQIPLADNDPNVDYSGPLAILISRVSASASEIVAGTLKDYKRAVIVGGDHTFGKGSVQSVQYLPKNLGAWKTTVGMFYTAGGSSTQHKGVSADIILPSALSTDEIGEKNLDYSLPPQKIKSFLSKEAYVKDGPDAWKIIDRKIIAKLNKKSQKRVKESKDFIELKQDIAKAKKRGRKIKVSELFDEEKKKKDKEKEKDDEKGKNKLTGALSKEEKLKRYLDRPDIKEGVNVVVDMISLYPSPKLTLGAKDIEN